MEGRLFGVIWLETVVCSLNDAIGAQRVGARRIELVSAIELGGITPSGAVFQQVKEKCGLACMTMVRPRGGGFSYSAAEYEVMLRDAEWFVENGTDGIVTGIQEDNGNLDWRRMQRLGEIAGARQKVCHRCFDSVPDPVAAMESLIDIGFNRILTSGQQKASLDGADLIKKLIDLADGRIEIMPGGGLRGPNVAEVVTRTGCRSIHIGPMKMNRDASAGRISVVDYGEHAELDLDEVQVAAQALQQFNLP